MKMVQGAWFILPKHIKYLLKNNKYYLINVKIDLDLVLLIIEFPQSH